MAATNVRIKVLIGIAAAVGVYVIATSGKLDAGNDASASRSAEQRASAESAALLSRTAGRDVSSTRQTVSASTVSDLLRRINGRVASRSDTSALFQKQSWAVAPPPPPPPPAYVPPPPPPAPTAPPLPFHAMGSYARNGEPTVYFLTRGELVFDVRVGDTIDHTYSVDSAANGQMLLTYLPLKSQQTLAIGGLQ
jgi:hypothetical protein